MVDLSTQVTDLNAGWYNTVTKAMGIDPTTFQLAQGTLGLQTSDSSGLFLMADAQPAPTAVAFYDPAGLSRRSSAFNLLLQALKPEGGADLPQALGDQYANWIAYRNADTSDLTQQQLFERWANRRLDPGKASSAINVFKKQATLPLNKALDAFNNSANQQQFTNSAGNPYSLYLYSGTLNNAIAALQTGTSAEISFDSSSMDTSSHSVSVQGSASGSYEIFSAGVEGGFDQLNEKAASSQFTINGTIYSYGPLTTSAGDWFTSAEFSRAYNAKSDNTVWDPASSAGNWDSFFAQPDGSLARRISQLFLVGGYDLTVTSHATYSQTDIENINAKATVGVWPFFSASTSASVSNKATLNADGTMSVHYTRNKGTIQIWGATVELAPN
jgi:hypothetical protein